MGRRSRIALGSAVLLAGLYAAVIAGLALSMRPERSDVALVLGNAVSPDGRPSPRLRARLDQALLLFRDGTVARLLVSGGVERASGADEAAAMARYLRANGVPDAAIEQDRDGNDTLRSARNAAARLGPKASVVVVSQWFHLPRTVLALRGCGMDRVSGAWPRWFEVRDLYSFARELVALPVYAVRLAGGRCGGA